MVYIVNLKSKWPCHILNNRKLGPPIFSLMFWNYSEWWHLLHQEVTNSIDASGNRLAFKHILFTCMSNVKFSYMHILKAVMDSEKSVSCPLIDTLKSKACLFPLIKIPRNLAGFACIAQSTTVLCHPRTRASIHQAVRHLTTKSREVSKPRDWVL